jgi:DNA-binding response OmpR family regulator
MEKIIDNLISNAVKYSHNGGKVLIEFKADKGRWTLTVKDNGIGISKKAQRKLFREFYRGENAMNLKIVGSGIGLLLVKNYVLIHGGNISFESKVNVGSTFRVTIPYKEVTEKEQAISSSPEPELIFDVSDDLLPTTESYPENMLTRKMSVLIVEDNDELRKFIANKIENEFTAFVAEDGEIAWQMILEHLPDLIISDVMMPNKNGFELCKQVKTNYETSHIPIILLTALTDKAKQLQGLGLGADDYLTKPFDMNLLVQKIRTIIRNREVVREKALKLIDKNTAEPLLANEINDKFVKKLMEVAWANMSNASFDKDEFASAMNVSASLLYKKTKSLTGQSPTDLIKTIRLRHASELLQSRKYTVTEVSEMCGFSSVGYFSTVFKNFFGKSPSEIVE